MSKLRNKLKGFTLIELMIVVAIIGILAAIAIPNFIRYQLRSKTSEVRTNIGGIKTSEESFRATEDNYAACAAMPNGTPRSTKMNFGSDTCSATCNRQTPGQCTAWSCIGFKPAGDVYYDYQTSVVLGAAGVTPEFAVGGIADLDADGSNGSFSYQTANKVGSSTGQQKDGLSACNNGQPPSEVVDCAPGNF